MSKTIVLSELVIKPRHASRLCLTLLTVLVESRYVRDLNKTSDWVSTV